MKKRLLGLLLATTIISVGNAEYIAIRQNGEIVAYIPEENYQPTDMPPTVAAYLSAIPTTRSGMRKAPLCDKAPVEPLVTSKWGQHEPYNNLCPMIGDQRAIAGCLAISMAQVMRAHEWPLQGTGEHAGIFFSQPYDWTSMEDEYPYNAGEEAYSAALLCYHAGMAVDMEYDLSESGAMMYRAAVALPEYFGYDNSIEYVERAYYTDDDWHELIYSELAEGRPVIFSGFEDDGTSGHAFVIDGFLKEDFFHVNWGWHGSWNGYFRLDLLNPYNVEKSGFSLRQDAVINIKPDEGGEKAPLRFGATNSIQYDGDATISFGSNHDGVKNISLRTADCRFGLEFANGISRYYTSVSMPDHYLPQYGELDFNIAYPENMPSGDYIVRLVYREEGVSDWMYPIYPVGATDSFTVTYDNPTGIQGIDSESNDAIYDIFGRKLREAPDHGLYIINGRKEYRR